LPRPDDLIKALFVVAGIMVALVSTQGRALHHPGVPELILFVVAVEWLIYQSRYQWNDIRGRHEDDLAPSKADRQRLPGGTASIPKSALAMILRLIGVFWVASLAWDGEKRISHTDWVMFLGIAMIYLAALIYEEIRQAARDSQTSSTANLALTLVTVGLGYPIRFALGWWGAGGAEWSVAVGLILVAAWGLGILFVSLGWILEFADYIHSTDSAGTRYLVGPAIATKPHLLTLAKLVGIDHAVSDQQGTPRVDGGGLRIIPQLRFAPWSPWVVGSTIWYLGMSISIGELLGVTGFSLVPWGVAAAIVVAVPVRWRGGLLPPLFAGLVLVAGVTWNLGKAIERPAAMAVLFVISLLAMFIFIAFYLSSYRATRRAASKLVHGLAQIVQQFADWFVGSNRKPRPSTARNARSRPAGSVDASGTAGRGPGAEVSGG
jgi:hypothetical protein